MFLFISFKEVDMNFRKFDGVFDNIDFLSLLMLDINPCPYF